MTSILFSLVSFIVALGILVAVHEWGHFWVARRCGVKVERFSIGFGKALWRKTDKLGTEYVIAAIPLGGYVKMLDDRVEPVKEQDLPYTFNHQPVLKRIAIIAAGPGTNFIFAIFALWLMFMLGQTKVHPLIGSVAPQSIAALAGMQANEKIIAIGEQQTSDWESINIELMSFIGNAQLPVTTEVSTSGAVHHYQLDTTNWAFDPDKQSSLASLGIKPWTPNITTTLALISEDSPASRAGLQVNDKILRFNGTPVNKWEQIVGYIEANPATDVTLTLLRDGREVTLPVSIGRQDVDGKVKGFLGVVPQQEAWPESYLFVQQFNPVNAIYHAAVKTWRWMTLSVEMIGKLITGDVSVKNLSGPISIAQGAGISAAQGLVYFLSFLALISVNLGIINLLPLPVLDGGHLLYYFIELLTGKPVPESVQETGFKIGGAVLLLLMTIAIVNDITRLS